MSINQPPGFIYISPGLLNDMRREVRRFLLHTYTRTSRLLSRTNDLDTWGQPVYVQNTTSTSNIPCFYAVKEVPVVTSEGMTTLNLAVLTLGFDDTTVVGDYVTNIQTLDGFVLVPGPAVVESLQPRDPNMGGPVLTEAHIRQVENIPTS